MFQQKLKLMNERIKELSLSEMQTISGGSPWWWKAAQFVAETIIGDIFTDPEGAAKGYRKGKQDADRMWGK